MQLCFPTPHVCGTVALTRSAPLLEGLTEPWSGAGRTQELSRDHAAASAQRLRLGAGPPQKKFLRSCSSSVSGIMENHNTHLAPGFTLNDLVPAPANVVVLPGPLGPLPVGDPHSLYPMSSQRGNCLSPCGPKNPGLRSAPGDSPFPPEHHQVWSRAVSASALPVFSPNGI